MIEIIEAGTKTTTKCKYCGCKFSYENEDIKHGQYKLPDVKQSPMFYDTYIECPQCHKSITLKTMKDNVNHPDHYQNIAGVETIDILNDVVKDLPGKQAAMLWNSMKYLFRFQKKNGVEDLKKARNYLDYLINDIEATQDAAKDISEKCPEFLWDTWYSNKYGSMTIFAKSKEPNGMPSKLVFDTEYAAEEFRSVFYNMLSEGYDEFSITDAALEMKFKISKGNKWNKWDDLVNWKEVHGSFTIEPVGDKYELIFNYKDSSSETPENTKHYPDFECDLESEEKETEPDTDTKAKVDRAIIIVEGTKEEPYFEILYHLLGEDDDRIGFGSYCLANVFNWREQYLEVVNKEDK